MNHSRHAHAAVPSCAARASSSRLRPPCWAATHTPVPAGDLRRLNVASRHIGRCCASQPLDARRRSCTQRPRQERRSAGRRQRKLQQRLSGLPELLQPGPESASSSSRPSWAADGMPIATSLSGCSLPPAHRARRPRSAPQPPPAGARALGGEWLAPPALTPPSGPSRMPMRIPGPTDTRDWLCAGRKNVNHPFPHFVALRL